LLTVTIALTILGRKLTPAAAITGALLSIVIFSGTGFPGVILLGAFFLIGILVTSWRSAEKVALHLSGENEGKRNMWQVLANGGVAGICGALAALYPAYRDLLLVTLASSLSAAAADTTSSELGSLLGKKFYHIVTLRPDKRGENGVVSVEGFLSGVVSSGIIGFVFVILTGWNLKVFLIIIIAGTCGNIMDSLAGATLERRRILNNDAVNFLNTMTAGLVSLAIWATLH